MLTGGCRARSAWGARQPHARLQLAPQHAARGCATLLRARGAAAALLTEPVSALDVDAELWQVLDMCGDDELEALHAVLHAPSPLSPLVKSVVRDDEPPLLSLRGRASIMHKIEARFRFLAADSTSTMRGRRPSYRQALLLLRDRLGVPCSSNLATPDLEVELFLHILQHCSSYVQAEGGPDPSAAAAVACAADGDGMSSSAPSSQSRGGSWADWFTAPLRLGGSELLAPAARLTGAVTVTAVLRRGAAALGRQVLSQHARCQAAAAASSAAAAAGGRAALLAQLQRGAALNAAQRGLAAASLRYGALQGALSLLGPAMWAWLAADLVHAAVGTDYARVVRAVYILAQVRLVTTHGWVNPPATGGAGRHGGDMSSPAGAHV